MKRRCLFLFALVLTLALSFSGALHAQTVLVCPLSQGFWSSHPENWPVTQITLGSQPYTREELLAILPGGGDASTQLAVQLVAAKLNVANGADSTVINTVITQADALLAQFSGKLPYSVQPSSDIGQQMVSLSAVLDAYNNRTLTPSCVQPTPTPSATPAGTTIIIEGPVTAINVNIITVSNITVQVNPADPVLATIQIGDIVRVEGTPTTSDGRLIVVAVVIVVVVDADATPSATPPGTPVATPTATATPNDDDDDLPITIVIEGPVTAININIITIYDIDVRVDDDDPILRVIQIGDVIRVEGDVVDEGGIIVIVAINIIFVNVDVVIVDDDTIWRDDGNCNNPPPDWAPANGWRRRCQPGSGGGGMGMGMGMGDDDDD